MRRRLLIFLVLLTCGMAGAWAEELTKEQALELARQFVVGHQGKRAAADRSVIDPAGQVSGLYVFNVGTDGGFVIISNDDQTTPILGYSDCGSIDPDNLPANLSAWLQSYADQIAWVKANGANGTHRANRTNRTAKAAIAPLVHTQWSQGVPYNTQCPVIDGERAVTGCLATTMAQIMYYHYARNGFAAAANTPIPGYTTTTLDKNEKSITLDVAGLSTTTFDWANMTTTYTTGSTGDAANAVTQLMLYCGTALQMAYGLGVNGGSAAYSEALPFALKTYFGYDGGIQHCYRKNYSYDAWVDLIYNELTKSRPVALGGQSCGGGHSFICDGYDNSHEGAGSDYFHINWGWSGSSNGYFLLSVLDPYEQGLGGSSSLDGFSYSQDAVIGIQRPDEDNTDYCLSLEGLRLNGDSEASLSSKTFTRASTTDPFSDISLYYAVYSYCFGEGHAFDTTVQLVDGSGTVKETFNCFENKLMNWNGSTSGMLDLTISPTVDDGTYYIKVMSRPHGEEKWQECHDGEAYKLKAVISGTTLTIDVPIPDNTTPASVTFGEVTGDKMTGHEHTVTATITGGTGKYNGNIFLRVNNETVMGTILNIGAGEKQVLRFSFNPLKAGPTTIALYNSKTGGTLLGTEMSIGNIVFTLDNEGDNTSVIEASDGTTTDAKLNGRTLYKDGKWNTLCLPFDVTITGSPLDGAEVRTLSSGSLVDGTLTLTFSDPVTTLQAGTPYIIKWPKAEGYDSADPDTRDIKNPVFTSVKIDNSDAAVARRTILSDDGRVQFKSLYSSRNFTADDMRYLLVGANNTLYWPKVGATIGAQRAYFQIDLSNSEPGGGAPELKVVLNFGDVETTSLREISNEELGITNYDYYTLDGRKLNAKPTQKGLYIVNGRKVVIQ